MNHTKIPWCDYTWNPIVGCSPASEGCANCYASAIAHRFGSPWGSAHFKPERLDQPANAKKPARIFVCSMGDLFHPTVKEEWFREVYSIMMRKAPWHTYMLLTKRPENIPTDYEWDDNIWLGVTAENQKRFEERWERMAMIDASTRFVSVESMLGPIDMKPYNVRPDWVIAGPENGPKARECRDTWIDDLQVDCSIWNIPFFDKRTGDVLRQWPVQRGKK